MRISLSHCCAASTMRVLRSSCYILLLTKPFCCLWPLVKMDNSKACVGLLWLPFRGSSGDLRA